MEVPHIPVLRKEAVAALAPRPGGKYLDGTIGFGGHAEALLEREKSCRICGLDRDMEALAFARERLSIHGPRTRLYNLRFSEYEKALAELGWSDLDGVILDLGVSSRQIDSPERGFSFLENGPLDMRMGAGCDKSAADIINSSTFEELRYCLASYGEEPLAGRIAGAIIRERQKKPITATLQLADIVARAYPAAWRRKARKHPATKTFQALRIAVNNELDELAKFLEAIPKHLRPGSRLAIISFHSLEDRLVKNAMRAWSKGSMINPFTQGAEAGGISARLLFKKPLAASEEEIRENPRASSAKLRAMEKIG